MEPCTKEEAPISTCIREELEPLMPLYGQDRLTASDIGRQVPSSLHYFAMSKAKPELVGRSRRSRSNNPSLSALRPETSDLSRCHAQCLRRILVLSCAPVAESWVIGSALDLRAYHNLQCSGGGALTLPSSKTHASKCHHFAYDEPLKERCQTSS